MLYLLLNLSTTSNSDMGINRVHRRDGNHAALIKGLERAGASVQTLAQVGHGCPDLLVGFRGINVLVEVKDRAQPPSKRKLSIAEDEWHSTWRGQVCVAETLEDALRAIGILHAHSTEPSPEVTETGE